MTDTTGTLRVRDGSGVLDNANIMVDTAGSFTPQYAIRLMDGVVVGTGNPLPVVDTTSSGTDGTGIVPPTGGTGVRGWLSGIYASMLTALTSLSSIVTNTTGIATAANQSTGNTSLATVATNTGTTATASGTPADAAWGGSGSSTIIAALKAIWTKLGALTISGPLPAGTNAIGSVTVAALTYSSTVSGSVAITSGTLVTAGAFTRALTIATLPASTTNVWLNPSGGAAAVGSGIMVAAGGGSVTFGTMALPIPTGNITAITDAGTTQAVSLVGG